MHNIVIRVYTAKTTRHMSKISQWVYKNNVFRVRKELIVGWTHKLVPPAPVICPETFHCPAHPNMANLYLVEPRVNKAQNN